MIKTLFQFKTVNRGRSGLLVEGSPDIHEALMFDPSTETEKCLAGSQMGYMAWAWLTVFSFCSSPQPGQFLVSASPFSVKVSSLFVSGSRSLVDEWLQKISL